MNAIHFGLRDRADELADMLAQLGDELRRLLVPARSVTNAEMAGLSRVVLRDHRCLGDRGMVDQRRFDLGGGDAMAGDVHDVVDAAHEPEVAVLVDARAVAGEVLVAEACSSRSPCSARRRPRCRAASPATAW